MILDGTDRGLTILSVKELPDLDSQLKRIANKEAYKLACLSFPGLTIDDNCKKLRNDITAAITTFKVPDYISIDRDIRPPFYTSVTGFHKIYPNAL